MAIVAAMSLCGVLDKMKQGETTSNSNTAQPAAKSTPGKEAVKAELVKMEEEMSQAAMDGDITLLAKNTTDDFKITNFDGKIQNKNEALADVKKEKNLKAFSITDADLLSFSDDAAVLLGTIALVRAHITPVHREAARRILAEENLKPAGSWR